MDGLLIYRKRERLGVGSGLGIFNPLSTLLGEGFLRRPTQGDIQKSPQ